MRYVAEPSADLDRRLTDEGDRLGAVPELPLIDSGGIFVHAARTGRTASELARRVWGRAMRLWHLTFGIAALAVVLTLARDPIARVCLIVFAVGLGEAAFALGGVMALFQTIGAIGQARGLREHAEALGATVLVLCVTTVVMDAWFFAGFWLARAFV